VSTVACSLASATVDDDPFSHLFSASLLDPSTADGILAWLDREAEWELVAESFYNSWLCTNLRSAMRSAAGEFLAPDALLEAARGLEDRLGIELDPRHIKIGAHKYLAGQSVGVHTDAPVRGTETHRLVLHLTSSFDPAHGGCLEFFRRRDDETPVCAFPPLHNSAVAFELSDRSFHRVTHIAGGVRYSIVCSFWRAGRAPVAARDGDRIPVGLDPMIVALLDALGADELPHQSNHAGCWSQLVSARSLRSHLLGTGAVLRRWGCDDDVVVAGLLHSAYGALGFGPGLLRLDERPWLRSRIGSRAEQLVFWFSELDRSTLVDRVDHWEGRLLTNGEPLRISADEMRDLQLIMWANLVEQLPNLDLSPGAAQSTARTVIRLAHEVPRRAAADVAGMARVACRR
jgi:hypothetical protein